MAATGWETCQSIVAIGHVVLQYSVCGSKRIALKGEGVKLALQARSRVRDQDRRLFSFERMVIVEIDLIQITKGSA